MTKMYTLKPGAQTTTSYPFLLNRNQGRIRSMTVAACQRNEIWNTAATQCQYTINEYQPKLPSTIILMSHLVVTLPMRTKKYRTHLSSCGKNSNDEPSHRQQKTAHTPLLVGQDSPIAPSISSRTRPRTKQQKTAHTTLPKELADTITSPIASRTRSKTTTVPTKRQEKKTQIQLVK